MIKGEEVYVTNDFRETQKLGEKFAKDIVKRHPTGAVLIALRGELGSGKTTFVQGLAKGFRIKRRIISPTFLIVRSYKLGVRSFYHIDLYRIKSDNDIEGLGLEEIIKDPQNIVAIEWAEKMGRLLPRKRWEIRFEYAGEDKRRVTIKSGRN